MCYIQVYQTATIPPQSLAVEIVKSLQSRQHLGKAAVVCDNSTTLVAIVRKHWLKSARNLQKERAGTINAEKILRLTNSITHMHRMRFTAKPPESQPRDHVYFLTEQEIAQTLLPSNTYSLYVVTRIAKPALAHLIRQLPHDATLVDYVRSELPESVELQSKRLLEEQVAEQWDVMTNFLEQRQIFIAQLVREGSGGMNAVDDALDTLLGTSHRFLQVASAFQHVLELAQPLTFTAAQQRQYDIIMLLAHRVHALSPSPYGPRFTYELASDELFFLHDIASGTTSFVDIIARAADRHQQAGRTRLARALLFAEGR